jgi:argininosuccinate lyase
MGKKMSVKKPWAGRFSQATHPLVEAFTASIQYDCRLLPYDIRGSRAHLKMLARQGIVAPKEARRIEQGLKEIETEWLQGKLRFPLEDEDVHMFVEKRLIQKIGPAGGKLHTARSRNDQVALDLRLFLADQVRSLKKELRGLQKTLLELAKKQGHLVMPGYTHLQRAQPVLVGHHLLAYLEMFGRDQERLAEVLKRVAVLPLGSAALAGTAFPIDRAQVAGELGFPKVAANSMDAVSDRDFVLEFLSAGAILMMHFSRWAEELILWSSAEFDFIEISDAFCTGSSIMPQKKNPDVPELIRGKTGRVYGHLMAMLTVMKALPLTYNRDLQEDKEAVFDTVDTLMACTRVLAALSAELTFKAEHLEEATRKGFLLATELADYLAGKGVDFRTAHGIAGKLVARAQEKGLDLNGLKLEEYQRFHPAFGNDLYAVLSLRKALSRRRSPGGTAPVRVKRAIKDMERKLERQA